MADIASRSLRTSRPRRPLAAATLTLTLTLAALLATAPGAIAAAAPPSCADAHVAIMDAPPNQMRTAVLCLVNLERTERHLPALLASVKLDRSAQGWTDSMVESDDFSHGTAFMNRISATGFDWSTVGENIATGFQTPAAVVRAWMQSPGHCANILDPAYREVGTGVLARRIPRVSSLVGTWTQDFGRLMDQPALSENDGPADACYRR